MSIFRDDKPGEVDFPQPMDALLSDSLEYADENVGWLTFIDPKRGHRTSVPVSTGPARKIQTVRHGGGPGPKMRVWHIEREGADVAVTTPSIHHPGEWHTPNPCRWRIVTRLADELTGIDP